MDHAYQNKAQQQKYMHQTFFSGKMEIQYHTHWTIFLWAESFMHIQLHVKVMSASSFWYSKTRVGSKNKVLQAFRNSTIAACTTPPEARIGGGDEYSMHFNYRGMKSTLLFCFCKCWHFLTCSAFDFILCYSSKWELSCWYTLIMKTRLALIKSAPPHYTDIIVSYAINRHAS